MRLEYGPGMPLTDYAARWVDMAPHINSLAGFASQASSIVEFGVRGGVSTWALLDGLPADGRMTSVDIDPAVRTMVPPHLLEDPRWTLVIGNDLLVDLPEQADLVMIDSSHEYNHTLAELAIAAMLRPDTILLHDYLYAHTPDVRRAVDEFVAARRWNLAAVESSNWGLAVLKPE